MDKWAETLLEVAITARHSANSTNVRSLIIIK